MRVEWHARRPTRAIHRALALAAPDCIELHGYFECGHPKPQVLGDVLDMPVALEELVLVRGKMSIDQANGYAAQSEADGNGPFVGSDAEHARWCEGALH